MNDELKRAKVKKVNFIGMRLESETTRELLDITSLIATFLHELAHCFSDVHKKKVNKDWVKIKIKNKIKNKNKI